MTSTPPTEESFDLVNVVGKRLRERRRELGLTLAEVAADAIERREQPELVLPAPS